jgi:NADH dehydrogenase [ubiquinone] 1 alpha subcomplex assembly factor 7
LSADPISRKIARRIGAEGPLSVAAFMAMALHDPEDGYYARRSPVGAQGDFITAPEISQVFGELIGLWCAVMWQRLGEPDPIILAELGPGRGVLIEDLLRAAAAIPTFRRALRLHLVEASPALRAAANAARRLRPVWCHGSRICRKGRCCWSPTSSSTRCRFASSCAAKPNGRSEWWRSMTTIASSSSMGPKAAPRVC